MSVHHTSPTRRLLFTGLTAAAGLFAADVSQAAVLALYDFTGGSGVATSADPGVTANNVIPQGNTPTFVGLSGAGNAFMRSNGAENTLAAALDDADYHTVTISAANVGEVLDLDSLTFNYGGQSDNATPWTINVVLQTSVGGFGSANPVITGTGTSFSTSATTALTYPTVATVDLTGAAFQGLTSITFQIRYFDNLADNGKLARIDNLTVNGDVVPEPGSLALLGLGGLLIGIRRRRDA